MSKNLQIGDKVSCVAANSPWFKQNWVYTIVSHPQDGALSVVGSDGLHDKLAECRSKFEKFDEKKSFILKIVDT